MRPNLTNQTHARGETRLLPMLLLLFLCGLAIAMFGVASYFFLGSDARALRNSFMAASGAQWHQKIAVNVGGVTTGIVRLGSRFFKAPQEVRAGIDAVRGVEVGIYRGTETAPGRDHATALVAMDKKMRKRGWQRLVGVLKGNDLVAVYVPPGKLTTDRLRCCFLVLHDSQLVVGSARGSLDPILELPEVRKAMEQPWFPEHSHQNAGLAWAPTASQ
jgi:hypothetical protein